MVLTVEGDPTDSLITLGQHGNAAIAELERLAPAGILLQLQQTGGQQLQLDLVLARPAGRAPDLHQAAAMDSGQGRLRHGFSDKLDQVLIVYTVSAIHSALD